MTVGILGNYGQEDQVPGQPQLYREFKAAWNIIKNLYLNKIQQQNNVFTVNYSMNYFSKSLAWNKEPQTNNYRQLKVQRQRIKEKIIFKRNSCNSHLQKDERRYCLHNNHSLCGCLLLHARLCPVCYQTIKDHKRSLQEESAAIIPIL